MNKIVLTSIFLLGSICFVSAQKRAAWINAADTALYVEHDYYKAFKYYEAALLYDTTDIDLWYRKAEAARLFNAYYQAEKAYLKVVNSDRRSDYPCALAYAGQMRLSLGGYDAAEKYFQRFLREAAAGTEACREMAERNLENIAFVRRRAGVQPPAALNLANLGGPVNTPFSDFGVYPLDDGFYYSRYEYADYENKDAPGRRFARIYKVTGGGAPEPLPRYINPDTTLHFGHTALSRDGSRFYYTICEYTDGVSIHCDLYYREADGKGGWGQPVPVREVNMADYTATQPSVGWDQEQDREVLYFVSDRPGGAGGLDIWSSVITDGRHESPSNLGEAINTPYDEATPFFHELSQRLFFSSGGHSGYGGLDVFFARKHGEQWTGVENLGAPINGAADEVYYALNKWGTKAYFSSNRLGSTLFELEEKKLQGKGEEERLKEACCLDIYSYDTPPCDLIVNTYRACDENGANGEALSAVDVKIYDITDGEPGTLLFSDRNAQGNDIQFAPLQPFRKYKIVASKERYDDAFAILDFTAGAMPCQGGDSEMVDICLSESCPQPLLSVQVLNGSGEPMDDALIRLIELGETNQFPAATTPYGRPGSDLCPDDALAIYGVFPGEQRIQSGEVKTLEYDVYYGLIATKDLFSFDTLTLRIQRGEVEGPDCVKTATLRLEPIDELSELTLYFDNDSPYPDTRLTTSDSSYVDIYRRYYQKKAVFTARFSVDASDFLERQNLDAFFERELRGNAERLAPFADSLLTLLCQGAAVDLEMNGCASPRFNDANNTRQRTYNEALTQRRMDSVMDFFREYRKEPGGPPVFQQFLGGQLRMVPVKRECQVADRQELSDLNDLKNSIFSIDASVARRVAVRLKFRTQQ